MVRSISDLGTPDLGSTTLVSVLFSVIYIDKNNLPQIKVDGMECWIPSYLELINNILVFINSWIKGKKTSSINGCMDLVSTPWSPIRIQVSKVSRKLKIENSWPRTIKKQFIIDYSIIICRKICIRKEIWRSRSGVVKIRNMGPDPINLVSDPKPCL